MHVFLSIFFYKYQRAYCA